MVYKLAATKQYTSYTSKQVTRLISFLGSARRLPTCFFWGGVNLSNNAPFSRLDWYNGA